MYYLLVTHAGKKTRLLVPPEPALLVVGSDPACDVVVADPGVDPRHLEVSMTGDSVLVRDLETRKGTRVNGGFVNRSLVTPGDEITFGEVRASLAPAKGPASMEPASQEPAAQDLAPPAPVARPAAPRPAAPKKAPPRKAAPAKSDPGEPRPAPSRPRRKKSGGMAWIAVAVVVLAVGGLAYVLMSESGRTKEAGAAYDRAYAQWERKDVDGAETGFRTVIENWPDTTSAARAKAALTEIADFRKLRDEAFAERKDLLERWRSRTEEQLGAKWDALAKKYDGTGAFADRAATFATLGRKYDEEERRRLDATRAQAGQLVRAGRYWDAVLAWHEYASLVTNVEPDRDAADREVTRIQAQARASYEGLAEEAEKLIEAERYVEAKALLRGRLPSFRGTRHAFDLRQKLDRAEVLSRVETEKPEETAEVVVKRDEFLRSADRAEALVQGRRYGEAVALYREVAEGIPYPDLKAEFLGRASDLEDYAFLLDELRAQINGSPDRFRKIELGSGITADATSADATHITVSIRGARSKLAFARMGAGRILDLLLRLSLEAGGRVKLARFAFEAGNEEAGHAALTKALGKDESLSERAFAMLARARGIPVPEGGFVLYRKRWLTPTEKAAAELADAIADASKLARSSDSRRRDEGLGTLRNFGEPAKTALVAALAHQLASSVEELRTMPAVRDAATKAWLHGELTKRRKAAFVLIFDSVKYPYPYGPDGNKAVQAEVDGLVGRVRQVWENPLSLLMEKHPELKEVTDRAESYSMELADLGHELETPWAELVTKMNDAVGIKRYAPGSTEKSAQEWNDDVLEYNRVVDIGADDPEKACVLATNEYRIMMGRRAVMMNDKLLKCARAHSTDMKENNFFAHDCPIPGHEAHRKPGQRARIAGYGGGVSENIARGSQDGRSTFRQWYGSSGHHRNLLGKNHTEVGVGRNTDFWTQNFGSQKKKVDLPAGGGGRR